MVDRITEIQLEAQPKIELENILQKKRNKKLRVYVDYENDRKLIDNFAAAALGLITFDFYKSNEMGYYVISNKQLEELSKEYEIEYVSWEKRLEYDVEYIDGFPTNLNNNENGEFKAINQLKELREQIIQEGINNQTEEYKYGNNDEIILPRNK